MKKNICIALTVLIFLACNVTVFAVKDSVHSQKLLLITNGPDRYDDSNNLINFKVKQNQFSILSCWPDPNEE